MYLMSLRGARLLSEDYASEAETPAFAKQLEQMSDDAAAATIGGEDAGCSGNRCGGDSCGGNLCGGNICGGNACGGNLCIGDICGGNACGGNVCFPAGCLPDVCFPNVGEIGYEVEGSFNP